MFLEYFAKILGMVRSIDETVAITERDKQREQLALKYLIIILICLLFISIYFVIGFFFDAFAEACPILFLPIVPSVFLGLKKQYHKKLSIFVIIILILATFGASFTVGLYATSKPGYGEKIISGKVETINYSKSFMKNNYDINQRAQIKVWIPDNYDSSKKYPVMFVLDGDNLFNYAAQTASFFSSKYYNAALLASTLKTRSGFRYQTLLCSLNNASPPPVMLSMMTSSAFTCLFSMAWMSDAVATPAA